MTLDEVYAKLALVGDCWEWQGYTTPTGYALVTRQGTTQLVHRITFEHLRVAVPVDLELDHLCRNPSCCNPWHLEPVTHAVNMQRSINSYDLKTHCANGHEVTPENTYTKPNGRRQCRTCRRLNSRARRASGEHTASRRRARARKRAKLTA